ncbi:MAG TPA: bifunctional phosphopantothenoylcysteine decarboxylase/phosphopantothenate--cysteine ligase CoaBC [Candidatus Avirikenella pullistercoris]|nr:bifunctional phosphopantothenoylcysteine decarboxylase/phosphopantothenate--cysteine ligase CoaBC [Candidatus Avirikenella pullistercoris]
MMLEGKKILLGVTGSIAAYKAAILVRALVEKGAEVKVVMTELAKQFITPLTMATLSKNPVLVDFFNPENGEWNSHVKLGLWADAYVIAPATANTIGKMAHGVADNLLLTSYLSARCPVFVSPAMDLDMYAHSATQRNMAVLRRDGVHIIEPGEGFLASGLIGKGRMEEPHEIVRYIDDFFDKKEQQGRFRGKKVVVTAGGTIEPIDSVRFVSNYSSGKMGYAIAAQFAAEGADVTIVHAAVDGRLRGTLPGIKEIKTLSAAEMYEQMIELQPESDIIVMAAAVADYTPEKVADHKLKKKPDDKNFVLVLKETQDIAEMLGKMKKEGQLLVGFALETDNEADNALKKLKKKNLDFIILNSLRDKGAGFATDTNKITIYHKNGERKVFPLKSKPEVAVDIVNEIAGCL